MKRVFLSIAFTAAAVSIAACGGGNSNPPAPGPTCSPPAGTQTALAYPAPGATAIPDQFGQVIIAASPALPSSWDVVLTTVLSPNGVAGGTFTTATPPFPTPNATPGFANPTYQSSSFGNAVFPGEVVQVFLNNTASQTCTPIGPIGSFTTQ
jgi:hypothetical protein